MILVRPSYALEINEMRIGAHPDKTRIVFEMSGVSDFRAFTLSSPYRIVIDLPRFAWRAGQIGKNPKAMISDIRQGQLNSDISRIVLDLDNPITIESAFTLPKTENKPVRLVIDYRKAPHSEFIAKKSIVHGTLKTDIENTPTTIAYNAPIPPQNSQRPVQTYTAEKPLIVIDPGHGGKDPGAHSNNKIYEKNIVLALSKELKRQMEATGRYRVIMTRNNDTYIRLKDRVTFAQKHNADLFISIHADTIHKSHIRGTSVYTISKKASDAQTAKLAEKENQSDLMAGLDLSIEDEQVAFILGDFLMNDTMNQSKFFANTLVTQLKKNNIRTLDNAHRYAGFAVLKAPNIPSVLIEAGFLSNSNEAKLLNQPHHRQKIARSILSGVDEYFHHVHNNEQN